MAELPKAVMTGTMMIGDIEIEVVQLDDGRRIIPADSMKRALEALGVIPRRCDTGECAGDNGDCLACGAANGQNCLAPHG